MSNVLKWELHLKIKDNKSYEKLVTYLGKSHLYSFEVEPMYMEESSETHYVLVTCSWANNLNALAKWVNKNIKEDM